MNEHIVRFERGHDCIRFECAFGSKDCKPNAGGSHGVHGMSIRFVSKGDAGAVQFVIDAGWYPKVADRSNWLGLVGIGDWGGRVFPSDLGYHSKKPIYDGQQTITESCKYCDGQPCYYDGSSLNASGAMYTLVNGGDDALWKFLDEYYDAVFNDREYPTPTEYEFPKRSNE